MLRSKPCAPVSQEQWAEVCSRICSIFGVTISSKGIIVASMNPKDVPELGEFAKGMSRCCNELWKFGSSKTQTVRSEDFIALCDTVNSKLIDGSVLAKMIKEERRGRRSLEDSPPDGRPKFSPDEAWSMFVKHSKRLSELSEMVASYDFHGYMSVEMAHRLGGFAYTFPFDMAAVCPYGGLNGMTGLLVAEGIRLRLGLPFWGCKMNQDGWKHGLSMQCARGEHFSDASVIPSGTLFGAPQGA